MTNLILTKTQIDEKTLEVIFSCASERPNPRRDKNNNLFLEVLVMQPEAVDLSRLRNGASLLFNHINCEILGIVTDAWLDDKKLFVKCRFRRNSQDAKEIFEDLVDGTIRNVSLGYEQREIKFVSEQGQRMGYVTKWMPFEVSIVGTPADDSVGFYRSLDADGNEIPEDEEKKPEGEAEPEDAEKKPEGEAKPEDEEKKPETEAKPEDEEKKPETEADPEDEEKKPDGEAKPEDAEKKPDTECRNFKNKGFMIMENFLDSPLMQMLTERFGYREFTPGVATRDMTGTTSTGLIATETRPDFFVERLRPKLGGKNVEYLTNLTGNVSIPVQSASVTAEELALNAAATSSDMTVGSVNLTPKAFIGTSTIGADMLYQSCLSVQDMVINDITLEIAAKMNKAIFAALAAASGVQTVDFKLADVTWAKITDMVGAVEDYELGDGLNWAMRGKVKAKLKQTSKDTGSGRFICEGNKIDELDVAVDGTLGDADLYLGCWRYIKFGIWGSGLNFIVDPYTLAKKQQVIITGSLNGNAVVTQAKAFVKRVDPATTQG